MKIILRGIGIVLFLALFTIPIILLAQEDDTIEVTGSRIVIDILMPLVGASDVEADVNFSVAGTSGGFAAFCQGTADITGANRPISLEEEAECLQNEVAYAEYLIGYNVIALVAHPELTMIDCLSTLELNALFAPSAESQVTSWAQVGNFEIEAPLSIYLPPDDTSSYAILDRLAEGVGLRRDVTTLEDEAAIISAISTTPGAVGLVRLNAAADAADNIRILELGNRELGRCFAPTQETIEDRQYVGADRLFIYVNLASAQQERLNQLLTFITAPESAPVIQAATFTPPSDNIYAINQAVLAGEEAPGRQFSLEVTAFQIPPNIMGIVTIGGNANLTSYLQSISDQFNLEYPGVTVTLDIMGEPAGLRQLCNGELDILIATQDLPADVIQNCEANNIQTHSIAFANPAVVLVANAGDTYLECLTADQLITIWGAPSTEAVTQWNQVNEQFPETPLMLFAPPIGTEGYTDLLLTPVEGPVIPQRLDVSEENRDHLYRAAATANVEGALTYMSWQQYQGVLTNEQANIQLVAVEAGGGCVQPSIESITDGSYPLMVNNQLIVNLASLTRSEVQSFLWYVFSDENFALIERAGLVGLSFGNLPARRDALQTAFTEAIVAVLPGDTSTPFDPETLPELPLPPGEEEPPEVTPEAEVTPEIEEAAPETTPEAETTPETDE